MLIRSAVEATEGNLNNIAAMRAALKSANFDSVRGKFAFNNNHFPIQSFFLREVTLTNNGTYETKVIDTVYTDHKDPYANMCPLRH